MAKTIPGSPDPLTERLQQIYRDALRDLGYPGHRFLRKVQKDGGLASAKYYLRAKTKKKETDGFRRLLEADRLDLSVEAVILDEPQWQRMFATEELDTARDRLDRYGYLTRRLLKSEPSDQMTAEELPEQTTFPEGVRTEVILNAYERNPAARQACIDHYGPSCQVCGFNFGEVYGEELGGGRIQVHHLTPFAASQGTRETDPIRDLRPVCANCHWMLHRRNPPISIWQLKQIVENRKATAVSALRHRPES